MCNARLVTCNVQARGGLALRGCLRGCLGPGRWPLDAAFRQHALFAPHACVDVGYEDLISRDVAQAARRPPPLDRPLRVTSCKFQVASYKLQATKLLAARLDLLHVITAGGWNKRGRDVDIRPATSHKLLEGKLLEAAMRSEEPKARPLDSHALHMHAQQ